MRARGRLLALCLAPAAWLLGGCGQDIEHTWFPLADGLHWEYRVTRTDARGQREVESFSQTNLGRTTLQGTTVFERRNSHGTHYFIEAREDGLGQHVDGPPMPIKDDHLPFMRAGIPSCDLIDFSYGDNNEHWHKASDLPSNCSEESLGVIGRIVLLGLPRVEQEYSGP